MTYEYKTRGVCSRSITFELDDEGRVYNVAFLGGCDGNAKGIAALADGCPAVDIIDKCRGITCGYKKTSCPDQLADALEKALAKS